MRSTATDSEGSMTLYTPSVYVGDEICCVLTLIGNNLGTYLMYHWVVVIPSCIAGMRVSRLTYWLCFVRVSPVSHQERNSFVSIEQCFRFRHFRS